MGNAFRGETHFLFYCLHRADGCKDLLGKGNHKAAEQAKEALGSLACVMALDGHTHLDDTPAEDNNADGLDRGKDKVGEVIDHGDRIGAGSKGGGCKKCRAEREDAPHGHKALCVFRSRLAGLHEKYRIGIIANQIPGTADRMKAYGLFPMLDLIVASAEEGVEKPDLRIFRAALERANCRPENAVMIGDRIDNDIVPAKKAGMMTIWIRQGFGGMAENLTAEETPDYCVRNLQELVELLK